MLLGYLSIDEVEFLFGADSYENFEFLSFTRLSSIESQPKKIAFIVFVVVGAFVVVFVVVVVAAVDIIVVGVAAAADVFVLVVVISVGHRNLTLKSGQNWVNNK